MEYTLRREVEKLKASVQKATDNESHCWEESCTGYKNRKRQGKHRNDPRRQIKDLQQLSSAEKQNSSSSSSSAAGAAAVLLQQQQQKKLEEQEQCPEGTSKNMPTTCSVSFNNQIPGKVVGES
jgi:hypothetical protein